MKKLISVIALILVIFTFTAYSVSAEETGSTSAGDTVTESTENQQQESTGESQTPTEPAAPVKPAAPASVKASSTKNTITVNWSAVEGADGYALFYKAPESTKWTKAVKSTTKINHTFTKVTQGKRFTIAVQSYKLNQDGSIVWGEYKTVQAATQPAATKKLTSTQNESQIKLSWEAVPGATHYRIYYKTGDKWKSLGYFTARGVIISKLSAGTKYTFAVRSYIKLEDAVVTGDYRIIETATKTKAPNNIKASVSKSSIGLTWEKVSGADGYRIYYKTSKTGAWKIAVSSMTGTSKSWSKLSAGTTYYFAIRPYIKTASGAVFGSYTQFSVTTLKQDKWMWPIGDRSYYISYGYTNSGADDDHPAVDITGSSFEGSPVYAARAGKVVVADYMEDGYGYYVKIDHGDGYSTLYGHNSKLTVAEGQTVKQGQIIGYAGKSGNATGANLHFAVIYNGKYINPATVYPTYVK